MGLNLDGILVRDESKRLRHYFSWRRINGTKRNEEEKGEEDHMKPNKLKPEYYV